MHYLKFCWIGLLGFAAGFLLLIWNLFVFYHLGDAAGNPRTTFGGLSDMADRYLTGLDRGEIVFVFALLGAFFGWAAATTILSGLFALKRRLSKTSVGIVAGGVLLCIAYTIGHYILPCL